MWASRSSSLEPNSRKTWFLWDRGDLPQLLNHFKFALGLSGDLVHSATDISTFTTISLCHKRTIKSSYRSSMIDRFFVATQELQGNVSKSCDAKNKAKTYFDVWRTQVKSAWESTFSLAKVRHSLPSSKQWSCQTWLLHWNFVQHRQFLSQILQNSSTGIANHWPSRRIVNHLEKTAELTLLAGTFVTNAMFLFCRNTFVSGPCSCPVDSIYRLASQKNKAPKQSIHKLVCFRYVKYQSCPLRGGRTTTTSPNKMGVLGLMAMSVIGPQRNTLHKKNNEGFFFLMYFLRHRPKRFKVSGFQL